LEIHSQQLTTLHARAHRSFVDELVDHVTTYFPAHAALGEPQIRRVIDHAVARAQLHGFTSERNICLYLDLVLMLGADLDVDPQIPWAAEILADPGFTHPTLRIDHLTNTALTHLERTAGVDDVHLERAVDRLRRDMDDMIHMVDRSGSMWPPLALRILRRIWPERCDALGEVPLAYLIRGAYEGAHHHGLAARHDLAIYLVCTFLFGSGFAHDPQYPWAAAALAAESGDGARKAERLYQGGLAWLVHMFARTEVA